MKEMVYGSKVAMPNNIDSDVKLEKDTVFQVQKITCVRRIFPTFYMDFKMLDEECDDGVQPFQEVWKL